MADLTNERPNVYLEVGYAMGIDKLRNLVLTCRSDHLPGNAGWNPDGPKVHFDLAGYDILFWEPSKPDSFREQLESRIRRRRALLSPVAPTEQPVLDVEWVATHREIAARQMTDVGFTTYMETSFAVTAPKPDRSLSELSTAASNSMIRTFGWPIGIIVPEEPKWQPQPRSDGIVTEVSGAGHFSDSHYDYWALRRNGDFFLRKSLFEDKRDRTAIFFDTRIVRNTELLLYAIRLYDCLGFDPSTGFEIELRYGGLEGRVLRASSPERYFSALRKCSEDQITTSYAGSLQEVEGSLTEVVKQLTAPMLSLFDFFEVGDSTYQRIVEAYVDGRVL